MKILVFCSDGISKSRGFLTGGGLRSVQIIQLMKNIADVVYIEPLSARNLSQDFGYEVTTESQQEWIEFFKPDFVYFLNASAALVAREPEFYLPYSVDIHGPIHIESSWINQSKLCNEVENLKLVTRNANFITVANDRQKYGVIYGGFLNDNEFMNSDQVIVVPVFIENEISMMSEEGQNTSQAKKDYVYSIGSIYPWHDLKTPFINLIDCLKEEQVFRLIGSPHKDMPNSFHIDLFIADLSKHARAEAFSQLPRDKLNEHFKLANCIIDVSESNSERMLAANTRVAEFLSLGIPTIVDQYSYFGEMLKKWGFDELVVKNHDEDLCNKVQRFLQLDSKKLNKFRRRLHSSFKKEIYCEFQIDDLAKYLNL